MTNKLLTIAAILLCSTTADAYVECSVVPTTVHSGDDGNVYIFLTNGGIARINQDDDDFRQTFALATAALLAGRGMVVRYADGTSCSASMATILGLRI